jgi:predicted small lipoprotein YifL
MFSYRSLLAAVLLCAVTAGCGQSGALVLPESQQPAPPPAAAPMVPPEDDKDASPRKSGDVPLTPDTAPANASPAPSP